MKNADDLVGNPRHGNSRYCFAKRDQIYRVYLPKGGEAELNLRDAAGDFSVSWFNPRSGGDLFNGSVTSVNGGGAVSLGLTLEGEKEDWLVVVKAKE